MFGHLAFVVASLLTTGPRSQTPPVLFEPNRGQAAADVAFLARTGGSTSASIGRDGTLTVTLTGARDQAPSRVSVTPLGARTPRLHPLDQQRAVLNLLLGRDVAKWRRGVPLYGRVRANELYPGIDVEYYATRDGLEYDFVVGAGADPSAIRLQLEGGRVRREPDGSLVVTTTTGNLRHVKPVAYQMAGQRREPVDVSYALQGSTVALDIGRYDRSRPLVIDPLIVTSTFAGGSRTIGLGYTTFTADGLYVGGSTSSSIDVYVAKYSLDGRTLLFETVYGGSGDDVTAGIGVDRQGRVYIAGTTSSPDLPSAGHQLQPWLGGHFTGDTDGFLATLGADGASIVLSTYFGSNSTDTVRTMALGDDSWYVSMTLNGSTKFFPSTPSISTGSFIGRFTLDGQPLRLQVASATALAVGPDGTVYTNGGPATSGAFQSTPGNSTCSVPGGRFVIAVGCGDGLVSRYSADLSTQLWGTYLRETAAQTRNADDKVLALAVDRSGAVAVVGTTLSTSFPLTAGAFETVCTPCDPSSFGTFTPAGVPFVARIASTGASLSFSTFLGGSSSHTFSFSGGSAISDSTPTGLAVDATGNVTVVGKTTNAAFPSAGSPLPHAPSFSPDDQDVFITTFSPSGTVLYSSRFGGADADTPGQVAASLYGTHAIVGTASAGFPMQNALQTTGGPGFLAVLSRPRITVTLDVPSPGGLTRASGVMIRGWAVDTDATSDTGIDHVDLTATPVGGGSAIPLGAATLGGARPDVALALGGSNFTNSGFSLSTSLSPGQYVISAVAHSSISSTTGPPATALVTALAGPRATIQAPAAGTQPTRMLALSGYALDLDASAGTGVDTVHVWAYPSGGAPFFLGVATYGESRPELIDMFGAQFASSGFTLPAVAMTPGTYTIAAAAHSTVSGTFSAVDTVTVTIPAAATELHIDVPSGPSLYQGFTIGGWAIDAAAPGTGTGVDAIHVWAFPLAGGSPIFLGSTTTFVARSDVATARGARFLFSGFNVKTASVAPGDYNVVTFARSTVSQQFDGIDTRRLTVLPVTGAVIQITNIADGSRVNGYTTYKGYAFDPRAATGLGVDAVHVYLYPNWGSGAPAQFIGLGGYGTGGDPSVGARFGAQFGAASLSMFVPLPPGPGTHLILFAAHSTIDGSFAVVTRLVTVPAAQVQISVDRPQPNAVFAGSFTLGGWAVDRADVDVPNDGTGIEALQIYAYPVAGGAPIFVCGPSVSNGNLPNGGITPRPDVAAAFGARFLNSGFSCPVNASGSVTLAPGSYDLVVYALSSRTRQFSPPTIVRFGVQ